MLKKINVTKTMKAIFTLLMVVVSLSVISGTVLATVAIPTAVQPSGGVVSSVNNVAGNIIYIVQIIAFAAAVILLMMLAIKYLTASPDGKAEIKKSAVIYIVGAVILFAAGGILNIIRNWANTIS